MTDQPPPLNYEPRKPPPSSQPAGGLLFIGVILGAAVVAVLGIPFSGSLVIHYAPGVAQPSGPYWPQIIIFGLLAIISGWGFLHLFRSPSRRYFLAGLLLGAAIMCLVEGACYYRA